MMLLGILVLYSQAFLFSYVPVLKLIKPASALLCLNLKKMTLFSLRWIFVARHVQWRLLAEPSLFKAGQ